MTRVGGCSTVVYRCGGGGDVEAQLGETRQEVLTMDDADIAEALGHVGFVLGKNARGDRFWVECKCGYRSTGRNTVAQAIGAGNHHLQKEIAAFKTRGVPLSAIRRAAV